MSKLKDELEKKVKQINEDEMRMKQVKEWIDGYLGKIISFTTPNESYHVVFTKEEVNLREGGYPSCEASYRGSAEALEKVLRKELSASAGVKEGQLKVWGGLNEAISFEKLM